MKSVSYDGNIILQYPCSHLGIDVLNMLQYTSGEYLLQQSSVVQCHFLLDIFHKNISFKAIFNVVELKIAVTITFKMNNVMFPKRQFFKLQHQYYEKLHHNKQKVLELYKLD